MTHLISDCTIAFMIHLWSNKSLQATAMDTSVLTMTARLNIIIPSEAGLPWLCLSSGR
jgi:hypothetical protein